MSQISVISGKTSEDLAKKIAKKIKANLVKSEIRIFPDGESKITLIGKISKKRSIVIQSIFPPVDSNLVHTLSLITKAKENSSQVDVVVPYMGYARQDREFLPGEIVTMKVLAKLFKGAGASKIIAVDIHSLIGLKYFSVKTENVTAIPDLVKYFKKLRLKNPLIVSPDQGGKKRAKEFAKELDSDYIALEKIRDLLAIRARTQPINQPSCGSVFRNPDGAYAAQLIEAAGLKGYRVGGAEVSRKHANFIVNVDNAKAADVERVILDVQSAVLDRYDYKLDLEVKIVGKN